MGSEGRTLLAPTEVAGMGLRNRVVCAPHWTAYNADARYTDRYVAYLEARAAGGAGWVVTEPMASHPTSRGELPPGRGAWEDDGATASWRRLTDAVHAHGARISLTVGHAGRNTSWLDSGHAALAASSDPAVVSREVPRAATATDLAEIGDHLRRIAARAAAAGFDGVELQCTADYLFGSFLSPSTNRRTDAFGGGVTGRSRAVADALGALRAGAGTGLLVGMRVSADHMVPGGLRPDDAGEVVARVGALGLLDYVSVIVGSYARLDAITPTMGGPVGLAVDAARTVRVASGLPTIVAGRIPDLEVAERIVTSGAADLVAFARPFIADPAWIATTLAGRSDEVRRCLYCNQQCVTRLSQKQPISCVQNPAAGREQRLSRPARAGSARGRVVVVGAGPAGLEAAVTAAEGGHEVVVVDQATAAGGRLRAAWAVPGREELRHAVVPRVATLRRLGVELRLGAAADAAVLAALQPDLVVQATGAPPWRRAGYRGPGGPEAIAGLADADVRCLDDVTADPPEGRRVLVVDELGRRATVATVAWMVDRGCEVEVVTSLPYLGHPALVLSQEWSSLVPPLVSRGVRVHPFAEVPRVEDGRPTVRSRIDGSAQALARVDVVVLAMPDAPSSAVLPTTAPVLPAGDCVAPRDAGAALLDGRRAGLEVARVVADLAVAASAAPRP